MRFTSLVSRIGKPLNPREALSNRSSKWIARHFGISRRQAQRYKSGQAPLDRPQDRAKRDRVMYTADSETRRKVAADAIRNTRVINVGRVPVVDKSPRGRVKPGRNYRNVGTVRPDPELMNRIADALERGDTAEAERLMNDAVLRSPGKNYGSALDVADWPQGFDLI